MTRLNKYKITAILFAFILAATFFSCGQKASRGTNVEEDQGSRDKAGLTAYAGNPVLRPGEKGSWDAGALGSMTVLKAGDVYHMYYEAWGVRGKRLDDYNSLQIGHATSRDGLHWIKDPANPVIPKGTDGAWDSDGAWDPFVLYEDGQFKMWYGGGMDQHCDWGYAVSRDGVHFEKKGRISHLGNLEDDHIVHDKTTGHYFIYYWDRKFEPAGLFRAESTDEIHFDFAHATPISISGLDPKIMYKFTHVISNEGHWQLFFGKFIRPACKGSSTGFATSPDGLNWTVKNDSLLLGIDAEVLQLADNSWIMYYGKDGFFDEADQDIRAALYKGKLGDLKRK